jgi:hypothetical protein
MLTCWTGALGPRPFGRDRPAGTAEKAGAAGALHGRWRYDRVARKKTSQLAGRVGLIRCWEWQTWVAGKIVHLAVFEKAAHSHPEFGEIRRGERGGAKSVSERARLK